MKPEELGLTESELTILVQVYQIAQDTLTLLRTSPGSPPGVKGIQESLGCLLDDEIKLAKDMGIVGDSVYESHPLNCKGPEA